MGRALGVPTAVVALEVSGGEVELSDIGDPNPAMKVTTLVIHVYPQARDLGNPDWRSFRSIYPQ